jgi:CMP-2-keto-3-deoxyoctulosonic acid synthetase
MYLKLSNSYFVVRQKHQRLRILTTGHNASTVATQFVKVTIDNNIDLTKVRVPTITEFCAGRYVPTAGTVTSRDRS